MQGRTLHSVCFHIRQCNGFSPPIENLYQFDVTFDYDETLNTAVGLDGSCCRISPRSARFLLAKPTPVLLLRILPYAKVLGEEYYGGA